MHGTPRSEQLRLPQTGIPDDTHKDAGDDVWSTGLHTLLIKDRWNTQVRVGILAESPHGKILDVDEAPELMRAYMFRNNLGILIRRQRSGHLMIMTNVPSAVRWLKSLMRMLADDDRQLDYWRRKTHSESAPQEPAIWRLNFDPSNHRSSLGPLVLMNGRFTTTCDDSPMPAPSGVRIDWILSKLRYAMGGDAFEPERAHDCRRGICSDSTANPCPVAKYQLAQCIEVKRKERRYLQVIQGDGQLELLDHDADDAA